MLVLWSKMTTYLSDRGFPFVFWSFEYKDRLSSLFAILVDCLDAPSPWSFVWLDILWDGLCESVGLKKYYFICLFIFWRVVVVAEFAIFLMNFATGYRDRRLFRMFRIRQISVMISRNSCNRKIVHYLGCVCGCVTCVCGHECEYDKVLLRRIEYELTDIKYRKLSNDSRLVLIFDF